MYTNWTRMNIDKWSYQQLNKDIGQLLNVWYKTNCKGYFCTYKYIYDIRQLWASWFFFIFSVIVLTQKRYIFRHFGIYYLYLGYARIWNTIKIEIIVKWQTRMSLEPHPYPTPEIFFDPIRTRCNLSCSIAYRFQYSNKFKNNHILTALW